jgi:hypothetical protein
VLARKAGDLDGNGEINALDVMALLQHVVCLTGLDPCGQSAADVNRNGVVDLADAIAILRFVTGMIPALPVS